MGSTAQLHRKPRVKGYYSYKVAVLFTKQCHGTKSFCFFNRHIAFFIQCDTQDEVDYYWRALTADGGKESMCGWLKDKFGVSWQVIPNALGRYLSDKDRAKAERVMQAMLKMKKIVIADLDRAYAGS